jgi:hypothetical protein
LRWNTDIVPVEADRGNEVIDLILMFKILIVVRLNTLLFLA